MSLEQYKNKNRKELWDVVVIQAEVIAELEKERDALSLAQFVYAYYMEKNSNPIDLYNWMVEWGYLTKKEQGK